MAVVQRKSPGILERYSMNLNATTNAVLWLPEKQSSNSKPSGGPHYMRYAIVVLGGMVSFGSLCAPAGCTRANRTAARTVETTWVELHGTVIRKPWTKSQESWNAGGSEYYVLDVGKAQVQHRTAKEGVILRPTDAVPFQALEKFEGKRVAVRGRFVEGVPFVPPVDSMDQYPVRLDPTVPILRGSGFEVYEIDTLD